MNQDQTIGHHNVKGVKNMKIPKSRKMITWTGGSVHWIFQKDTNPPRGEMGVSWSRCGWGKEGFAGCGGEGELGNGGGRGSEMNGGRCISILLLAMWPKAGKLPFPRKNKASELLLGFFSHWKSHILPRLASLRILFFTKSNYCAVCLSVRQSLD